MGRGSGIVALALGALIASCSSASAATLEPIGEATYESPTYVTSDPRDPDRLFVTEQAGTIRVTSPGGTSLFLDLTDEVLDGGERGLWSMAFAPDFAQSRLFYVAYSAADGALTLDEYRGQGSPAATEATRRPVLSIPNDFASSNHNGGQLQFGPDGLLYWSTGEDAHSANSQDPNSLLGKILRLDPRQSPAQPQVWALGLRNPWRFSFDRQTGAGYVGDVGAGSWEEVDALVRGANYGWPECEGPCSNPAFASPVYAYDQNPDSANCGVMGGYVVRDSRLGDLFGRYLFADLCGGDLRSIDPGAPPPFDAHRAEGLSVQVPVSFGEDACGRVYVVAQGDGQVYRIEGAADGACPGSPDSDPPQTKLKLKPRNARRSRLTARLRSDEPGSTFECKLDRGRWKKCGKKRSLKGLQRGRHRFRARATDAAGNMDRSPAKRRFKTKPAGTASRRP